MARTALTHPHQIEPMQVIQTDVGPIQMECFNAFLVPADKVVANNYNPNHVSDKNMELLQTSIMQNGMCYPVITSYDEDRDLYVVIDGFHRYKLFCDAHSPCIPIIDKNLTPAQRMAATVQFNRARGVHQVELMGELVQSLVEQGVEDPEIAKKLGMDIDEVYRLKQITGIAELFKNQLYSRAWEMKEVDIHG